MAYQADNGIWSSVFAVPSEVVDQHIKLCGPLSLKALLVLLRHGGTIGVEELSALLNQPVSDVQDAMNYWVQQGVISQSAAGKGAAVEQAQNKQPAPSPVPAALVAYEEAEDAPPSPAQKQPSSERVTRLTRTRQRYTTAEINDMAEADQTIPHLIQETQACLGKPLTPAVTDLVVALYSDYGMQPDLVLMLLHYCVSIGKGNTKYVEKVAASWLENGIDTHEKAEREILRRTRQDQAEEQVKRAFGIYDRGLVSSEKKFIQIWTEEYKMELSLIQLAFERTVELKGKLSFPYINGILSNWKANGITTAAQAVQDMQQGRARAEADKKESRTASYEIAELEEMIDYGKIV